MGVIGEEGTMPTGGGKGRPSRKGPTKCSGPRLTGDGKKALALMVKWSDEASDVLLKQGRVNFLGKVVRFPSDTQDLGHFMFKTSFGVHATILLIGFDEVTVGGLPGLPPHITLIERDSKEPPITLSSIEGIRPNPSDIQRVIDQFRSWIKTRSMVQVAIGDGTRMSLNKCNVGELSGGMFTFFDEASHLTHLVSAKDSSTIELSVENGTTSIVLTNREANSYLTITDAVESPEEIFARFASFSRRIH
ncbi:MAG: hypothetical protein ABSC62_07685 [Terracidiphilus sp.]